MASRSAEETPTPQSIAAYVKANAARAKKAQHVHHEDSAVTRETDYKGHHIVVRTKYEVEVDGKRLTGHLGVNDAGSVHYHPIPNMSFTSALDMIKKIIDVFPNDFGPNGPPDPMPHPTPPHHHSGHTSRKTTKSPRAGSKTAVKRRKR